MTASFFLSGEVKFANRSKIKAKLKKTSQTYILNSIIQ